jgi:hypothetical protein
LGLFAVFQLQVPVEEELEISWNPSRLISTHAFE